MKGWILPTNDVGWDGKGLGVTKGGKFIDQLSDKYLWYSIFNVGDTLCETQALVEMLCTVFKIWKPKRQEVEWVNDAANIWKNE